MSEATQDKLAGLSGSEDAGAVFDRVRRLLEGVKAQPDAAWKEFTDARRAAEREEKALENDIAAIAHLVEGNQIEEALARIDGAMARARLHGSIPAIEMLHRYRGLALLQRTDGDRRNHIESAVLAFQSALELATDRERAAELLMQSGIAYSQRLEGDPAENGEEAVRVLSQALNVLGSSDSPDLRALIQTNLSVAHQKRERGDRAQNLREAADQIEATLDYRSLDNDANDWAYSQLNRGDILGQLARSGDAEGDEVVAAYQAVIAEADRIDEKWLVGAAHLSLGRFLKAAAGATPDDIVEAYDAGTLDELIDNDDVLRTSKWHLEEAVERLEDAPDPQYRGKALALLAGVLADLDHRDGAVAAARRALAILLPTTAPRDCASAAMTLGGVLSEGEDWAGAATAFRTAVEAADILFYARLEDVSRETDLKWVGNLYRWAAYAIARSGDPLEAALVLENGRTREMRRRFNVEGSDAALDGVPTVVRRAYEDAAAKLIEAPLGDQGAEAGRRFQEALAAIRRYPSFEKFAAQPGEADLKGAVEQGWPLIYVNPAPAGTILLLVGPENGSVRCQVETLSYPTSADIFSRLATGTDAASPDSSEEPDSYIFSIAGGGGDPSFARTLDRLLPWLGEHLAKPILEMLSREDAEGATLVPCGPLAVAPLHAAPVSPGGDCLLDHVGIRFAPSAIVARTSRRRAVDRASSEPSLLALGDPKANLPAASAEIDLIAQHFAPRRTAIALGDGATSGFLGQDAGQVDFIHLACHARGGLFDGADARIELADRDLSAQDLTAFGRLTARLVVVSACQTAQSALSVSPDEALSLGTALVVAGSACAIASLWSVDDAATALLMAKLYDEMFVEQLPPPQALGRAQLWLRDLSVSQEAEFLSRHPMLEQEFRRRATAGDASGRRSELAVDLGAVRPYSHPDYWAPFVAAGA